MSGTQERWRDESCDVAGQSPTPSEETSEVKSRHNPRQLTAARALEIFKLRPQLKSPGPLRRGAMMHCKGIAPKFGVSPKTVREIWAGRAWARATLKEWTEAEIETRASSISLMMRDNSACGASNPSDTTGVLQRTTKNDTVATSLRIPQLQHSLPRALGGVAPPNQQIQYQAPKLQAAALLGLYNGAFPSLHALLAAAHAPQRAESQQMQTAPPQPHTTNAAQLLAQCSSFHTAWGFGAATQLVGANGFELAQVQAKNQTHLQQEVHHFLQQYALG